jgi:hypothetical protein
MEENDRESVVQRAPAAGVVTGTIAGGLLAAYGAVDLPWGLSMSGYGLTVSGPAADGCHC